jgi:hypothetical protein
MYAQRGCNLRPCYASKKHCILVYKTERAGIHITLVLTCYIIMTQGGWPANLDDAQRLLVLQIALKCADLGHVAEEHDVHIRCVA